MVLQLTVFWYIGAVLGHVCLGLGVLALVTMLLSWVFFFPQWGLGVCVVLWSVGCKSIQFLVHSTGGDVLSPTLAHLAGIATTTLSITASPSPCRDLAGEVVGVRSAMVRVGLVSPESPVPRSTTASVHTG